MDLTYILTLLIFGVLVLILKKFFDDYRNKIKGDIKELPIGKTNNNMVLPTVELQTSNADRTINLSVSHYNNAQLKKLMNLAVQTYKIDLPEINEKFVKK